MSSPNSAKMVLSVFGFKMLSAAPKHRFKYGPNAPFSFQRYQKFQNTVSKSARMHRFASLLLKFSQQLKNVDRVNHESLCFQNFRDQLLTPLHQSPNTSSQNHPVHVHVNYRILLDLDIRKAPCLHLLNMFKFFAIQVST